MSRANSAERFRAARIARRVTRTAGPRTCLEKFTARHGTDAASDSALAGRSASDFRMSFGFMFVCCCWLCETNFQFPRPAARGENSPKGSRFEPRNGSSRRESALTSAPTQIERTHVRCYKVHGEGSFNVANGYIIS